MVSSPLLGESGWRGDWRAGAWAGGLAQVSGLQPLRLGRHGLVGWLRVMLLKPSCMWKQLGTVWSFSWRFPGSGAGSPSLTSSQELPIPLALGPQLGGSPGGGGGGRQGSWEAVGAAQGPRNQGQTKMEQAGGRRSLRHLFLGILVSEAWIPFKNVAFSGICLVQLCLRLVYFKMEKALSGWKCWSVKHAAFCPQHRGCLGSDHPAPVLGPGLELSPALDGTHVLQLWGQLYLNPALCWGSRPASPSAVGLLFP